MKNKLNRIASRIAYGRQTKQENRYKRDELIKAYSKRSRKWEQVEAEEDSVEAYLFDDVVIIPSDKDNPRYGFLIWQGAAKRPIGYFERDKNKRDRIFDRNLKDIVNSEKSKRERRERRREERSNFKHDFQVGDFLYCSWGYDQTNIDFYKVVEVVSDKTIRIQECAKKAVDYAEQGSYVVPMDRTSGPIMTKRVGTSGDVKITSYQYATKWGGEPLFETDIVFGH